MCPELKIYPHVAIFMAILASVSFLSSCTGSAPQIQQTFWQLNVFADKDTNRTYETLTLFVNLADEDGLEDIDTIHLIHDASELFWRLDENSWQFIDTEGEAWYGSNQLTMHNYQAFPRGTYRLLIADKAGENDRNEIYIGTESIEIKTIGFPSAKVQNQKIVINSQYQEHTIWILDDANQAVKIFTSKNKTIPINSLITARERQTATQGYLHYFNETSGYGLVYGPFLLK